MIERIAPRAESEVSVSTTRGYEGSGTTRSRKELGPTLGMFDALGIEKNGRP